jgi:hypothetical protein
MATLSFNENDKNAMETKTCRLKSRHSVNVPI